MIRIAAIAALDGVFSFLQIPCEIFQSFKSAVVEEGMMDDVRRRRNDEYIVMGTLYRIDMG
jgi:hypothetical protein